jgi:hypothetical protein
MNMFNAVARLWRDIERSFCIMQRSAWAAPWRERSTGC